MIPTLLDSVMWSLYALKLQQMCEFTSSINVQYPVRRQKLNYSRESSQGRMVIFFNTLIVGVEMKLYILDLLFFKAVFCVFTMSKDMKSRGKQEKNSESVEFKNFIGDILFYLELWFRWDQDNILHTYLCTKIR